MTNIDPVPDDILDMQLTIADGMSKDRDISFETVSELFEQYRILEYIEASYDIFNSMGMPGILKNINAYIRDCEACA